MERIRVIFEMKDGDKFWDIEETVTIGNKYLCRKSYFEFFTEGEWYELTKADNLSATFIANRGVEYFLKTYVEATLDKCFDFSSDYYEYMANCRKEKIDEIIND